LVSATEKQASHAALMAQLRGRVMPAVLTPLRANGSPHWPDFERYAEYVLAAAIGGIAVWAHTGRGLYLTEADRRQVLRRWRAAADLPIIAGAGVPVGADAGRSVEGATRATVAMAEAAADLGADAVMIYPPAAYRAARDREERLLELHTTVADRVGLPALAFHLHGEAGGYAYPPHLLADLLADPRVIGVKAATLDSAMACQETLRLSADAGKLAVTGEDRMFGPSLMWGADCALVGIAAAVPGLTVDVLDAWTAADYERFVSASQRLDRFAEVTFRDPIEGYVGRMMEVARYDGALSDDGAHDPFGPPLSATDLSQVAAVVRALPARPR
jgi:4-hydroxy-tetrahydrodipicolinate synthase